MLTCIWNVILRTGLSWGRGIYITDDYLHSYGSTYTIPMCCFVISEVRRLLNKWRKSGREVNTTHDKIKTLYINCTSRWCQVQAFIVQYNNYSNVNSVSNLKLQYNIQLLVGTWLTLTLYFTDTPFGIVWIIHSQTEVYISKMYNVLLLLFWTVFVLTAIQSYS